MFNKNFHEEVKSHFDKHSTQEDLIELKNQERGETTPGSPHGRERDIVMDLEYMGPELLQEDPNRDVLFSMLFNKLRSVPVVREFTLQLDSFTDLETQEISMPLSKNMGRSLRDICNHMIDLLLTNSSMVGFFMSAEADGTYKFVALKLVGNSWRKQETLNPSLHIRYNVLG